MHKRMRGASPHSTFGAVNRLTSARLIHEKTERFLLGCRCLVGSGELRLIDEELDPPASYRRSPKGLVETGWSPSFSWYQPRARSRSDAGSTACIGAFAIIWKTSPVLTPLRISTVLRFMVSTIRADLRSTARGGPPCPGHGWAVRWLRLLSGRGGRRAVRAVRRHP
jgi:hypothetical protein